jgi:anthranilate synthase/aminodeoxychorismate synthase-like glutamine amidotransferase
MILVVDNYDSFTYNLVQYVAEIQNDVLGRADVLVRRSDRLTADEVGTLHPTHIVISPGPGKPQDARLSIEIIKRFSTIPILGVCLGHQCLAHVHGAQVIKAARPVHGKTSLIHHDGRDLFAGLPSPFTATRYHSLIVSPDILPPALEVTARTTEGEIMGLRARNTLARGVQFHPESILTEHGKGIIGNFLSMTDRDA